MSLLRDSYRGDQILIIIFHYTFRIKIERNPNHWVMVHADISARIEREVKEWHSTFGYVDTYQ